MAGLSGKTALVTGASQGIGEEIARRLSRDGAKIVLAARNRDKLEKLAGEIAEAGGEAVAFPLDLGDPEAAATRLTELPVGWNEIDVLINNAGVTADNLLARMTLDDWQRVLTTNLTGAYVTTKALLRGMMRRRWGRVISVSSVVGLMGNAGQANYAASKAGLIGFTKSLARELGSRDITVNVVAPGYIDTAMTDRLPDDVQRQLTAGIPLKRIGTAAEVAAAVAFLASEEAGYITGTVLNVSGGLYI